MSDTEHQIAAEMIERLLADGEYRAQFRLDPAGTCRAAGLEEVAQELDSAGGVALLTLDLRESRSSLAGVMVAAAVEGVGAAGFFAHVMPDMHKMPPPVADVLSRTNLAAVQPADPLPAQLASAPPAPAAAADPVDASSNGAASSEPPAAAAPAQPAPSAPADARAVRSGADGERRERAGPDPKRYGMGGRAAQPPARRGPCSARSGSCSTPTAARTSRRAASIRGWRPSCCSWRRTTRSRSRAT